MSYDQTGASLPQRNNNEFYWSKGWRKLREYYIRRNPLCLHCKQKGIYSPAVIVDHIVEIDDDYSRRLDKTNLQSLCLACHNTKTAKEAKNRKSAGTFKPSDIIKWANTPKGE